MTAQKVTVEVKQGGEVVDRKTYKNPPKTAAEILERLEKAGYEGDLLDSEGDSLSGKDPLDGVQTYVLLVRPVPGILLCACCA
jgi:hypothetical protein